MFNSILNSSFYAEQVVKKDKEEISEFKIDDERLFKPKDNKTKFIFTEK